jgi:hypothetical protein
VTVSRSALLAASFCVVQHVWQAFLALARR